MKREINGDEHLKTDPPGKEDYDRSDDDSSIDCKRSRKGGAAICEHGRRRARCIDCKKVAKVVPLYASTADLDRSALIAKEVAKVVPLYVST